MMKFKFFFVLIMSGFLWACNNDEQNQPSSKRHPALDNPVVKPFTDALLKDSTNAELYFKRAEKLNEINMPELTQADLENAVRLAPTNITYRESLVSLLITNSKSKEALQQIEELQKQKPNDTNYVLYKAEAYLAGNNIAEAEKIITDLLSIAPNHPYVLLDASKIKAAGKDTAKALEYAQHLVKIAPQFYDGVYQLTDLYAASKNDLAIEWYQKLFKLDTLNAYPYYDLANFYISKNKVEIGKQNYIKAIMVDKDFDKAYIDLGKVLLSQDSIDKAERQFQIATQVAPASADAYYYKGLVYLKRNNKELAKKFFEQALIFKSKHAGALAQMQQLKN